MITRSISILILLALAAIFALIAICGRKEEFEVAVIAAMVLFGDALVVAFG